MFPTPIRDKDYWKEFQLTDDDIEFINHIFLEEETPLRTPELIRRVLARRIENEYRSLEKQWEDGDIYKPANSYAVGETVVFPPFEFAKGTVVSSRRGNNPEDGEFTVLEIEFEDGRRREMVSEFQSDHKLNVEWEAPEEEEQPDPVQIYRRHRRVLTANIVDALRAEDDMLFVGGRWFLKSLLLEVDVGFANLSEAILDMNGGGPMDSLQMAKDIGFGEKSNDILRSVSLDYALSKDDRFDEVGPAGKVLWFLKRMEPEIILKAPATLRYDPIPYNASVLTEEMLQLQKEIDDEHTEYDFIDDDEEIEEAVTVTLTYPHWRMGTLPLTQRVEHLFPTAYRAPRIRVTLVDSQDDDAEVDGWVVRDFNYVYGLGDFYQRHELPIGTYITISQEDDDLSRLIIDFEAYKPRSEWVWLAQAEKKQLHFSESQTMVGANYDDLVILGVDDALAIDAVASEVRNQPLHEIMANLIGELSQFTPQRHVHCKTLYSAVNMLKRCPPAPIFATLASHPSFINAGGPFWKLT